MISLIELVTIPIGNYRKQQFSLGRQSAEQIKKKTKANLPDGNKEARIQSLIRGKYIPRPKKILPFTGKGFPKTKK